MDKMLGIFKASDSAVIPHKAHESDVGLDLTIVSKMKDMGTCTAMYDTGIVVVPPEGFYVQVHPRSSLSKFGYVFANSTGIIDPSYTGTIKIVLTKVDPSMPDLKLPFTCAQLIMCRQWNPDIIELTAGDSGTTTRCAVGFGSTGGHGSLE